MSSKSVYYYYDSEDHVTEDWRNDAENKTLITEINTILKIIK